MLSMIGACYRCRNKTQLFIIVRGWRQCAADALALVFTRTDNMSSNVVQIEKSSSNYISNPLFFFKKTKNCMSEFIH